MSSTPTAAALPQRLHPDRSCRFRRAGIAAQRAGRYQGFLYKPRPYQQCVLCGVIRHLFHPMIATLRDRVHADVREKDRHAGAAADDQLRPGRSVMAKILPGCCCCGDWLRCLLWTLCSCAIPNLPCCVLPLRSSCFWDRCGSMLATVCRPSRVMLTPLHHLAVIRPPSIARSSMPAVLSVALSLNPFATHLRFLRGELKCRLEALWPMLGPAGEAPLLMAIACALRSQLSWIGVSWPSDIVSVPHGPSSLPTRRVRQTRRLGFGWGGAL